jgi:hypothetical protein
MVDAPDAVLPLLADDDERLRGSGPRARGIDRDTRPDAAIAQSLDIRNGQN